MERVTGTLMLLVKDGALTVSPDILYFVPRHEFLNTTEAVPTPHALINKKALYLSNTQNAVNLRPIALPNALYDCLCPKMNQAFFEARSKLSELKHQLADFGHTLPNGSELLLAPANNLSCSRSCRNKQQRVQIKGGQRQSEGRWSPPLKRGSLLSNNMVCTSCELEENVTDLAVTEYKQQQQEEERRRSTVENKAAVSVLKSRSLISPFEMAARSETARVTWTQLPIPDQCSIEISNSGYYKFSSNQKDAIFEKWVLRWMQESSTWPMKEVGLSGEQLHQNSNTQTSAIAVAVRQAVSVVCKNSYRNIRRILCNTASGLLDTEVRQLIDVDCCWLGGKAIKAVPCGIPFVFTLHSRTAIGHPCIDEHANITAVLSLSPLETELEEDIVEEQQQNSFISDSPAKDMEDAVCDEECDSPHYLEFTPVDSGLCGISSFQNSLSTSYLEEDRDMSSEVAPSTFSFKERRQGRISQESIDTFSFAASSPNGESHHEQSKECLGTADLSVFIRKGKENINMAESPHSISQCRLANAAMCNSYFSHTLLHEDIIANSENSSNNNIDCLALQLYFENIRELQVCDCTKEERGEGKLVKLKNTYFEVQYDNKDKGSVIANLRLDSTLTEHQRPFSRLSHIYSDSDYDNAEFESLNIPCSYDSDTQQLGLKKSHSLQSNESLVNALEKVDLLRSASFRGFLGGDGSGGKSSHRRQRQESMSHMLRRFQVENNFSDNGEDKESSDKRDGKLENVPLNQELPPRQVPGKKTKKLKSISKFVKRVKKMMKSGDTSKIDNNPNSSKNILSNKNNKVCSDIHKQYMTLKEQENYCGIIKKDGEKGKVPMGLSGNIREMGKGEKPVVDRESYMPLCLSMGAALGAESFSRSRSLQMTPKEELISQKLETEDDGNKLALNRRNCDLAGDYELRKCCSDICLRINENESVNCDMPLITRLQVKNLRDGTYSILGHLTEPGQFYVNIKISGKPVKSCPITISAVDPQMLGNGISYQGPFHPHKDLNYFPSRPISFSPHANHPPCHSVSYDPERISYAKVHPHIGHIDILFLVDSTTSMGVELAEMPKIIDGMSKLVKEAALQKCLRVGVIAYRDRGAQSDDQCILKKLDLTDNLARVGVFVSTLEAGGGSDSFPKAVELALEEAVEGVSWFPFSSRFIVWIGDGPPHGYQGLTPDQIKEEEKSHIQAKNKVKQAAVKVEHAIHEGRPSHEIAQMDSELSEAMSAFEKISKHYDNFPNGLSGRLSWAESCERLSLIGVKMIVIGLRSAVTNRASQSCLRTMAYTMDGILLNIENFEGSIVGALTASLVEQSLDRQILEEEVCDLVLAFENDLTQQSWEERQCTIIETMNQSSKKIHRLMVYPQSPSQTMQTSGSGCTSIGAGLDSLGSLRMQPRNREFSQELFRSKSRASSSYSVSQDSEHSSHSSSIEKSCGSSSFGGTNESGCLLLGMECTRFDKQSLVEVMDGIRRKAETVAVNMRRNFDSGEAWFEAFLSRGNENDDGDFDNSKSITMSNNKRITQKDYVTYSCSPLSLRYIAAERCLYS